ncbi:hypothetical protein QMA64_03520 [Leuconostoc suionicum]|uniref:hypothetical protein n=1 Tax=Leuconostoc suionicum TaxID=1511761 RepID=UPI0024AE3DDE|nr:hypothetical protein [Leuconostoc suionicum]MDI6613657.1 hypothetical protein [Leuconostoc suionicum]
MIIFGIVGLIMLFWFALVGLWKLIPWLVLAVIVTSVLGFMLDHTWAFITIVVALVVLYVIGKKVN